MLNLNTHAVTTRPEGGAPLLGLRRSQVEAALAAGRVHVYARALRAGVRSGPWTRLGRVTAVTSRRGGWAVQLTDGALPALDIHRRGPGVRFSVLPR